MKFIESKDAPKPIGAYSQAVITKGKMFLSGQIGINPITGKLVEGGIVQETEQVFSNIQAILAEAGLSLSHVIKVTVLLSDMKDFTAMNDVYGKSFKGNYPARSAFSVLELPKGARVEIEVIAEIEG